MQEKQAESSLKQKINTWIPPRVQKQLLLILAGQCIFYWGAKLITRQRYHYCLAMPVDEMIPLLPWTVIIYFGCFFFWAVNYTLILREEPEGSNRFFYAEIAGKFICALIFIFMPTTLVRPEISGSGVIAWLMRFLYWVDAPDGLFPSIHCYVSWMCVIALWGKERIPLGYRVFSLVFAIMVFAATLTTKQHVVVDVIAGIIVAELVWIVSGRIQKARTASGKKDS